MNAPKNKDIKDIFFKHRSINVGFEIECFYDGNKKEYDEVCTDMAKLHPKMEIGGDGSLTPEKETDYAIEIKTPVLPAHEAVELLGKVFEWVRNFGYTNNSCSCHLNFSPKSDKQYERFNPVPFSLHPIWETMGKYFRRSGNRYCYNTFRKTRYNSTCFKTTAQKLSKASDLYDKYSAISLRNWTGDRQSHSRIEVRIMGNKDYHNNFNRIAYYTDKIFTLFRKCSQNDIPQYKI